MTQIRRYCVSMAEIMLCSIGERVAMFRKQQKLSAEEVAERAGHGLTRSVIANLENGRKDDLSVKQLVAVAYVLGVSPVDLVVKLEAPYKYISLTDGENYKATAPAWLVREWFGGQINGVQLNSQLNDEPQLEAPVAHNQDQIAILSLENRSALLERLGHLERLEKTSAGEAPVPPDVAAEIQSVRAKLYTLDNSLRAMGFDLENPVHTSRQF